MLVARAPDAFLASNYFCKALSAVLATDEESCGGLSPVVVLNIQQMQGTPQGAVVLVGTAGALSIAALALRPRTNVRINTLAMVDEGAKAPAWAPTYAASTPDTPRCDPSTQDPAHAPKDLQVMRAAEAAVQYALKIQPVSAPVRAIELQPLILSGRVVGFRVHGDPQNQLFVAFDSRGHLPCVEEFSFGHPQTVEIKRDLAAFRFRWSRLLSHETDRNWTMSIELASTEIGSASPAPNLLRVLLSAKP